MNFGAIPSGISLFLDANVFVYEFGSDAMFGPPSLALLNRIDNGDLSGVISTHVFDDVAHRLMTLDACLTLGWSSTGIVRQLRRHPTEIAKLLRSRQALDRIVAMRI